MKADSLRRAVLQLAVSGKLVEQREVEGTAKTLLSEIAETRKRLTDAGELKKQKPLPAISEDEKPFVIPESWEWIRLGDVVSVSTGKTPATDNKLYYENGKIPWITSSYTGYDKISEVDSFITEKAVNEVGLKLYPKGTLLYAMYGQGKTRGQISELLIESTINQALAALELIFENYSLRKYIIYFCKFNYHTIRGKASGTSQPNLNMAKVANMLLPLPPLAEQRRIVERLEELMPLIDQYDVEEQKLSKLDEELPDKLRQSILQYAVEGKLVEQRAEEGNAASLLKEIAEERERLVKDGKMKKSKPLPEITEEEIPFEIPERWEWVRLGNVCILRSGNVISKYLPESEVTVPYVKVSDLNLPENQEYLHTAVLFVDKETYSKQLFPVDSILFPKRGGAIATNKKRINKCEVCADSNMMCITPSKRLYLPYVYYYFKNIDLGLLCTGAAVPQINNVDIAPLLIPLPPLAEQKRIVERLDELMGLVSELTAKK